MIRSSLEIQKASLYFEAKCRIDYRFAKNFLALALNAAVSLSHRSSIIVFTSGMMSGYFFDKFLRMVSEKAFIATAVSLV